MFLLDKFTAIKRDTILVFCVNFGFVYNLTTNQIHILIFLFRIANDITIGTYIEIVFFIYDIYVTCKRMVR